VGEPNYGTALKVGRSVEDAKSRTILRQWIKEWSKLNAECMASADAELLRLKFTRGVKHEHGRSALARSVFVGLLAGPTQDQLHVSAFMGMPRNPVSR
jgi:hypothetical protein